MVARFGEEYRGFPKASGAGLMAWLGPPIALLLGLALVLVALRRMKAPPGLDAPGAVSEEDRERLDEALAALEEDVL